MLQLLQCAFSSWIEAIRTAGRGAGEASGTGLPEGGIVDGMVFAVSMLPAASVIRIAAEGAGVADAPATAVPWA
jgi:hypothetical protein